MLRMKRKDAQMVTRMFDIKRDQRGITGLETAIIMIAFVVVASVFAYTVLSAGIFSSEKGKEAVHAGLDQARSSMQLVGPVVARDTNDDDDIDQIVFIVANTLNGEAINLTTTTDADGDGLLSDESPKNHTTVISYADQVQEATDVAWTKTAIGKNDADDLLEAAEKFEITVDVSQLSTRLSSDDTFIIEVRPDGGASLTIERTTPSVIDPVTSLN
jgi:flagellin FlaB